MLAEWFLGVKTRIGCCSISSRLFRWAVTCECSEASAPKSDHLKRQYGSSSENPRIAEHSLQDPLLRLSAGHGQMTGGVNLDTLWI